MNAWLLGWLARYAIPVTLLLTAVLLVAYSLQAANWVRNDQSIVSAALWGVTIGLLLATSRWKGRTALLYTFGLAALVVGFLLVGELLPPLRELRAGTVWSALDTLNLRAFLLIWRVRDWATGLASGATIEDTGLFLALLDLAVWWGAAWLAWTTVRRQQPLAGLLPLGLGLGLNLALSGGKSITFAGYLGLSVLLWGYGAGMNLHADWNRRRVDYPGDLGLDWGLSLVPVLLMVGVLVIVTPLVATPEGWNKLGEWLRPIREETAETTARIFANVNPPVSVESDNVRAAAPDLSVVGQRISTSTQTVFWVETSDPAPRPVYEGGRERLVGPRRYWRSGIGAEYTGQGWLDAPMETLASPPEDGSLPAGRAYLEQAFTFTSRHGDVLFAVNQPVTADAGAAWLQSQPDGSRVLRGQLDEYRVTSWATNVTATQLAAAGTDYPPEIRATYLQLPDRLPRRVIELAERVTAGAETPYAQARLLQDYLRRSYRYDPNTPPPEDGQDAVDYFLFEAQSGFCTYYASAMAVMLRAEGVPARVATGYATGEWDADRGAYRVPGLAAHAWVEVYFPGYGWVEFEPTVSQEAIVYPDAPVMPQPAAPRSEQAEAEPGSRLPLIAAAAAFGLAVWALARMATGQPLFGRRRGGAPADLLYRAIRRRLAWAGLRAGPSTTPDEYLAAAEVQLRDRPQLVGALQRATRLYLDDRFSLHPPSPVEVSRAGDAWRGAAREWRALLARKLLRRKPAGREG
jgi:hypothetical protein